MSEFPSPALSFLICRAEMNKMPIGKWLEDGAKEKPFQSSRYIISNYLRVSCLQRKWRVNERLGSQQIEYAQGEGAWALLIRQKFSEDTKTYQLFLTLKSPSDAQTVGEHTAGFCWEDTGDHRMCAAGGWCLILNICQSWLCGFPPRAILSACWAA